MTARLSAVVVGVGLCMMYWTTLTIAQPANTYALDRKSTCGETLTVYDRDLILEARSNVAPANPPLECIVYLQSAYGAADGRSRLQIIVQQLQIQDCKVKLHLFNGRGATGQYLRSLGCGSSSTDIIYSKDRMVTVRFTRPMYLYQTVYAVTLAVRAYEDGDAIGTAVGVDTLSVGAIIGIVVGLLVVIAIAILLGWCCCTGYIYNFLPNGRKSKEPRIIIAPRSSDPNAEGSIDSNLEKLSNFSSNPQGKNGLPWEDSSVWAGVTANGSEGNRNFQRGVPRKAAAPRGYYNPQGDNAYYNREAVTLTGSRAPDSGHNQAYGNSRPTRDSHVYEPYDNDDQPQRSPRFRKRGDDPRASGRSRASRRSRNSATGEGDVGGGKETMIDDPGSQTESSEEEVKKKRLEDSDTETVTTTTLHREGSEVDVDTIASPMHINAAVRASVPDLSSDQPPPPSSAHPPRDAGPKGSPSPKSRKRPHRGGRDPDPMGLPPEAFDPVFTTPTSQEQYPGEWRPTQQPPFPMPFMPYGVVPLVPGQQTYAYAYQTAPQMGAYPGQQGAYFMQSVPTGEGDVQKTAFAMHSERTPKGQPGKGRGGAKHPGSPDFSSTPVPSPRDGRVGVPAPGTGHRSVAMKSAADPDTGVQTTQVVWTDNVPDPTDPKPGDSSQVTRKTTTRVTTRGGYGDLPQQTTTLLDEPDPNPAFLSPSSRQPASLPPAAHTPSAANVHYYTGQRSVQAPQPEVIHEAPGRSRAIRDTVTLSESSEV